MVLWHVSCDLSVGEMVVLPESAVPLYGWFHMSWSVVDQGTVLSNSVRVGQKVTRLSWELRESEICQ